ncbi:Transmembrane 6 superfamily member 1, partial [Orchesella cincta]
KTAKVRPFWMMASGFLILVSVVAGVAKLYINDWVCYGAVLFAFTAVIDLIITLEFNGVIRNFMSEYLKLGEPYLASSWGSAIALFDGIGFYFMYLGLVHLISNGKSWRSLGIYWGAGIINSMIVLILGIFTGKHSPTFCTFLNIPYVIFPMVALLRAFKQEKRPSWNTSSTSIPLKAVDLTIAVALAGCICITLAKGFTALAPMNANVDFLGFVEHEKSFLFDDPAPFPIIQAIVYLLYIVPVQALSLYYCLSSHKPQFLWEITLVHAGVMIQAQFSVIGLAFDPQTPLEFQTSWMAAHFWLYNLLILVVPHVLLWRLLKQHSSTDRKAL